VIVEAVFSLPGLGSLIAGSISSRDVIMVQGAVAFIVVAYVVLNTVVDIGYGFLDPRVRREAVR
jgi:peptide/nickel transport system permease protein